MARIDFCPDHGLRDVTYKRGDNVTLACGCKILADAHSGRMQVGDLVIYNGKIRRIDRLKGIQAVVSMTGRDSAIVYRSDLIYLGPDTVTGLPPLEDRPVEAKPKHVYIGDWVKHPEFNLTGEVVERRQDGKVKVEVYDQSSYIFKYFVWDPAELITAVPSQVHLDEAYKEMQDPYGSRHPHISTNGWFDTRDFTFRRSHGTKSSSTRKSSSSKKKSSTNRNDISTGGLISDEVKRLKEEEKIRPLRTSAPTRPSLGDEEDPKLTDRKGDWETPASSDSDTDDVAPEELGPIAPRKGDW